MNRFYEDAFPVVWSAWCLYWIVSAARAKRTVRRESALSRLGHFGPLFFAAWLLWVVRVPWAWLEVRLPFPELPAFWVGLALTVAGLLFSVWARIHIGRNWSGSVTVKADHVLVRSGPYAWVRHPIYTGLLLGFLGTGLALDEVRGPVATLIVLAAFWRKLRLEERFMTDTFGQAYQDYRREVSALIPHVL
ncbi:MAG: isoprenylcysteine carboxylmethyltransferase family protein [Burkholderiaceae bacterium]|jgi:protein-S-isoprenylcysteine O-methyltransferase Ste14